MIRHILAAIMFMVLMGQTAFAQDGTVRLDVGSEGTLWAGQQITLNLDLLTSGQSFSAINFTLPGVENALLLQTDSSTVKLTEQIEDQPWQGLRYPLSLYAQSAGEILIPALTVRFESTAGFGKPVQSFELTTAELVVDIEWPPGAPTDSIVISTRNLEMQYQWTLPQDPAKPGDAVRLELSRSAADISGMLLPNLPVSSPEGLAAYPEPPRITDQSDRGQLLGTRIDRVTWVIEQPGEYRLPGIRFQWWNPQSEILERREIPGQTLQVLPQAGVISDVQAGKGRAWFWIIAIAISLLIAIALTWPVIQSALTRRRADIELTEAHRYRQLCRAIRENDVVAANRALTQWLSCLRPVPSSLTSLARERCDNALLQATQKFQEALIERSSTWDGQNLLDALAAMRVKTRSRKKPSGNSLPQQLNPAHFP